ncbi:MAG: uroporphyrinogen-III synthase [Sphingomonadales bacterium]|jgi:uroporphyrinogen-III synthase|nr:uroporphyrinogen-III synthase [Sphingomonadales bacterium]
MKILILRPQPGAGETAARARALGLDVVVAPLFAVRPLAWSPPDPAGFDAVMLTSASAARQASDGLTPFKALPCYAVGEASAAAAQEAGFAGIRIGPDDGAALLLMMAEDGIKAAFHACGEDHLALGHPAIAITRVPVYAAEAAERLPVAAEGALALLHSPRAAALFARLAGDRSRIIVAAISARTARAAGEGWRHVAVAARPRDDALLELAAKLCQDEGQ